MYQKLSKEELAENQRWQERYGDGPINLDVVVTSEFVQIGDEIFSVKDLKRADKKYPQPKSHPLKPHHYLVQEAFDDLLRFYKQFPERKPRI